MLLSELLQDVNVLSQYKDREITDITDKTDKVRSGCVFVCIAGARFDGHSAAAEMTEAGAAAVIADRDLGLSEQIIVDNTREAYALMCRNFYGRASDKLKIIGITGTNGKTTTAFIIKDILKKLGIESGLIGTVKNMVGDEEFKTVLTTPDPYDMHALFKLMVDRGIEYCVMETSSQAFHQRRLAGICFKTAVFTNLSQDHLDYHGTIEEYRRCKKMLFLNCENALFNADDEVSEYMRDGISAAVMTYGYKNPADFKASDDEYSEKKVSYTLNSEYRVDFYIPGSFSVYNSLAAIGAVYSLGVAQLCDIAAAAAYAKSVKGRVERLDIDTPYSVIIDYAHTPEGMKNAITAVRGFTKGRVITVFGCGGDRDKTKRPKMGRVAAELSDIAVVTTDNPRTEEPEVIISEIMLGMVGSKAEVVKVTNRSEAIEYGMSIAREGDTVLLMGKGHETYQIIGTERRHYDEREIVRAILEKKG